VLTELLGGGVSVGLGFLEGHHALAEAFIGTSHDRAHGHARILVQHALDLGGIHVRAAAQICIGLLGVVLHEVFEAHTQRRGN